MTLLSVNIALLGTDLFKEYAQATGLPPEKYIGFTPAHAEVVSFSADTTLRLASTGPRNFAGPFTTRSFKIAINYIPPQTFKILHIPKKRYGVLFF